MAGLLIPTSHALFGNLGVLAMSTMRDTERTTPIQRVKAWQRFYSVGAVRRLPANTGDKTDRAELAASDAAHGGVRLPV